MATSSSLYRGVPEASTSVICGTNTNGTSEIQRSFRDKLENHLNLNQPFEVEMITLGGAVYD